jgi:hypothetical protein
MPGKKRQTRPTQPRTAPHENINEHFPAIAKWVRSYGWIEIGDQESVGFVARALDWGGMIFEDRKAKTLAEALASLERGIADHLEQER